MVTCFWIHLLCLIITGTLTGKQNTKKRKLKIAAAALLCTLIDTILTIVVIVGKSRTGILQEIGIAAFEVFLAARIAFGKVNCVHNGLKLLCITALIAGIFQMIPIRNAGLLCLTGAMLLTVLPAGIVTIFKGKQTGIWMYEAKICHRNEEKCLSAFMDTGNRLRLYGSKLPVILVDETHLSEWISDAEYNMPQKLVFIPYKGVGGKGLLRGVRLWLEVTSPKGNVIRGEVAAVAAEHRLFRGCSYQMLLQPEVIAMECVTDTQEGVHNVI